MGTKVFLFLTIFAVAFASCKKKDKEKEKNCSLSEANLVGSYKVLSAKYKASASASEEDYINQLYDPCEKDDVLTINADHTYSSADAGIACSPNNTYDGSWMLTGNSFAIDGDETTFENFDCTGFSISISNTQVAGDKTTLTYTKQ